MRAAEGYPSARDQSRGMLDGVKSHFVTRKPAFMGTAPVMAARVLSDVFQ
jgi:hypothetical protein